MSETRFDAGRMATWLIEIESILENARAARRQLESGADVDGGVGGVGVYEMPKEVLEGNLDTAAVMLGVILDAVGMGNFQIEFVTRWREFTKLGLGTTKYYPQVDHLDSKPLQYLEDVIRGLRLLLGSVDDTFETYELLKLQEILAKSQHLTFRRSVLLTKEVEFRDVMHDYLGACFPHYTRSVQIPGITLNFRPDGGVINLRAAIEFKFAKSLQEVKRALSGIMEDVSGYSGSRDWTRFFAVILQSEPFETEDRIRADIERAAAKNWTVMLVPSGVTLTKFTDFRGHNTQSSIKTLPVESIHDEI